MKPHIFDKVGGRKAALALITYLGTFVLTAMRVIPPEVYQYVTVLIAVAFITGNVAQKATAKTPTGSEAGNVG